MNRYKNIQEELDELKSSLKAGIEPVFNLPEGYFENFAGSVMEKIRSTASDVNSETSAISPLLASLSRKMPMSVPENYFEELVPSPAETNPVLSRIGKSMPYEVPAHYFEDLADAIHARVWKPKARVVPFRIKVMRMAAAAIITGFIAISGWLYFTQDNNESVTQTEEWVTKNLNGVSNQELEEFINTTGTIETPEPIAAGQKTEVREMLNDVSDNDLASFLAQIPEEEEEISLN